MIDRKNRYGRTAARVNDADGLARRPSSTTIDIHAHIVVPKVQVRWAKLHVDPKRIPLGHFADAATKEVNVGQDQDLGEVMTNCIDRRLRGYGQDGHRHPGRRTGAGAVILHHDRRQDRRRGRASHRQ